MDSSPNGSVEGPSMIPENVTNDLAQRVAQSIFMWLRESAEKEGKMRSTYFHVCAATLKKIIPGGEKKLPKNFLRNVREALSLWDGFNTEADVSFPLSHVSVYQNLLIPQHTKLPIGCPIHKERQSRQNAYLIYLSRDVDDKWKVVDATTGHKGEASYFWDSLSQREVCACNNIWQLYRPCSELSLNPSLPTLSLEAPGEGSVHFAFE